MTLPNPGLLWPIPYDAVCEIAKHESCRLKAYRDIVGVPTIGWGETRGVSMGMVWTQQEADTRFCESLTEFTDGVRALCNQAPNDNELGAMVSLAYNIGLGGFSRSTVLRKHNSGDTLSAARAFALWNKAGGKVVHGLTLRRAKEAAMYLSSDIGEASPMPQKVDEESTLSKSPIAQSGVISIAGGIAAAVSTAVQPIKDIANSLNIEPGLVLAALAVVVGVVVLVQRNKQRNGGWA